MNNLYLVFVKCRVFPAKYKKFFDQPGFFLLRLNDRFFQTGANNFYVKKRLVFSEKVKKSFLGWKHFLVRVSLFEGTRMLRYRLTLRIALSKHYLCSAHGCWAILQRWTLNLSPTSQSGFTCLKLTTETLKEGAKYIQS